MSLSRKECVPCKGGVPPLSGEELEQLKEQVNAFWPGGKLVLQYVPTRLTVWQKAISSLPLRLTRFLLVRNHQGGFYGKAQGDDFQTLSF